MQTKPPGMRLIAAVMVMVVLSPVTTPAPAEAADPLIIAGVASLAIVGVILIAYLIVAAGSDRRSDARLDEPAPGLLVQAAQTP